MTRHLHARHRFAVIVGALLLLAAPARAQDDPDAPRPKWGFIDHSGKMVIAPEFDKVWPFSDGRALVERAGKKYYIDLSGQIRIRLDSNFKAAYPFSYGRALVSYGGKYGYLDVDARWALPPQYVSAAPFSEGLASLDSPWLIDPAGVAVKIPGAVARVGSFSGGLAPFMPAGDKRWGYVDSTGKVVIEPRFKEALPFVNGWATVSTGAVRDRYMIDRRGERVRDPKVRGAKWDPNLPPGPDGLIPMGDAFYDTTGAEVLSARNRWYASRPFAEDVAVVREGGAAAGSYGFIDRKGEWAIKATYDDAQDFSEGLAGVMVGMDAVRAHGRSMARRNWDAVKVETKEKLEAARRASVPPRAILPDGRVRWVWYEARAAIKAYASGNRSYYVDFAVITAPLTADDAEVWRAAPVDRKRSMSLTVGVGTGVYIDTTGTPGSDIDRRLGLVNPDAKFFKANFTMDKVKIGEADIPKK